MGRNPCCSKGSLNRGAWSAEEDMILMDYIKLHGEGSWRTLPERAGLNRCGKSCRLRWLNYLRPDIKRGNISEDEEELIIRMHKLLGNRWSLIAGRLPGRTDNEIKNYWNTNLVKKLHQKQAPSSFSSAKNLPKSSSKAEKSTRKHSKGQTLAMRCMEAMSSPTDELVSFANNGVVARKKQEVEDGQGLDKLSLGDVKGVCLEDSFGKSIELSDLLESDSGGFAPQGMVKDMVYENEEPNVFFDQAFIQELMQEDVCNASFTIEDVEMDPLGTFLDSALGSGSIAM